MLKNDLCAIIISIVFVHSSIICTICLRYSLISSLPFFLHSFIIFLCFPPVLLPFFLPLFIFLPFFFLSFFSSFFLFRSFFLSFILSIFIFLPLFHSFFLLSSFNSFLSFFLSIVPSVCQHAQQDISCQRTEESDSW